MRATITLTAGLFALAVLPAFAADEKGAKVLSFKMKSLDGKDVELSKYQGKVVLFVNVASECGYTGQYKGLQALHDKYGKDGLAVVGVPCNDFGKQEPGTPDQIAGFCKKNYGVTFDLLEKVSITGKEPAPLYKLLTSKDANAKTAGAVKWNFTKFLIGKNGEVVARFEPDVEPDAKVLVEAVQKELAKK